MKVAFCVFSGTGNTRLVADKLKEELLARGVEAETFAMVKGEPVPDLSAFDVLLVGFPVHAFNAPLPALKYLKKLPKRKRKAPFKPAYLLRVSGEPLKLNEAAEILPRRILKRRGWQVKGEYGYVMPYNIIFRHSDKMAARMWRAVELGVPKSAEEIVSGKGTVPKIGAWRRFVSFMLRIEHPAMPVIGVSFRAKKKTCIGCGKCANVCPQKNIKMKNGKPKFGGSCAACMGCVLSCPTDAIRPSLLNGWRVNGKYTFGAEPATDEEVCDYCKKAYLRYFHEAEK